MRKRLLSSLIVISFILLLCGCTTKYDRDDIKDYVKENLKLTKIDISDTYEEITDNDDGYTDKLWTIVDNKHDITFHVLDDFGWGMESLSNHLEDDYDESVFMSLYEDMTKYDNIEYNSYTEYGLNKVELICNFTNKKELTSCYDSLMSYREYIEDNDYDLAIYYNVKYNFLLRNYTKDNGSQGEYDDGDSSGYLNNLDKTVFESMLINYYRCVLLFQDETYELSDDEINLVMNDEDTYLISILRSDGVEYTYEDIIAYSNRITLGTLYKILKSEEFKVSGSSSSYSVVVDEDTYEFSYDYIYDSNLGRIYFYIKNDETISLDTSNPLTLSVKDINEMFGLDLSITKNK